MARKIDEGVLMGTGNGNGNIATDPERAREIDELRNQIAHTRQEIGGTLDQIHDKLRPETLKEQALGQLHETKESFKRELHDAKESLKEEVREEIAEATAAIRRATIGKVENMYHRAEESVSSATHSVIDSVKSNPIPLAMVGVGLAWLWKDARGRRSEYTGRRFSGSGGDHRMERSSSARGVMERTGGYESMGSMEEPMSSPMYSSEGETTTRVGELGERAKASMANLRHKASDAMHHTKEKASEAMHSTKESLKTFAHDAREQGRRLEERVERTYEDNPLAIGVAALAVGTAFGLAIPITRRERAMLGGQRERVQGFVHRTLDRVDESVTSAVQDRMAGEDETSKPGGSQYGSQTQGTSPSQYGSQIHQDWQSQSAQTQTGHGSQTQPQYGQGQGKAQTSPSERPKVSSSRPPSGGSSSGTGSPGGTPSPTGGTGTSGGGVHR